MTWGGMCVGLVWVGKYAWCSSAIWGLYLGNRDRETGGSPLCGEAFAVAFAELFDELLLLRTSVGASEKDVCDRGISEPKCACGGVVIGEVWLN